MTRGHSEDYNYQGKHNIHSSEKKSKVYCSISCKKTFYATADETDGGGCVYVLPMFFFVFCFFHFFRPPQNMRQPFSGTAERIFMKLFPNDSRENVVFNVVPKWGLGPPNTKTTANTQHRSAVIGTAVALKRHERVNAFNLVY